MSCRQGYEINQLTGRCVKKCKEGFERNPVTGRCKKIPVLKFCKQGYERNPLTGRCIKTCKNDSERNPKTKRCIKKCKSHLNRNPLTGRCKKISPLPLYNDPRDDLCDIGTKELHEIYVKNVIFSDPKFGNYVEKKRLKSETNCQTLTKHFPKQFVHEITQFLGIGDVGIVFENTEPNGEKLALKVSVIDKENNVDKMIKEVKISNRFTTFNLAVPIKSFGTSSIKNSGKRLHSFIKMEKVDGTLFHLLSPEFLDHPKRIKTSNEIEKLTQQIFDILETMYDNRLSHGDLYLMNIGYLIDDTGDLELKLIDFGQSRISKRKSRDRLSADIKRLYESIMNTVKEDFIKDQFTGYFLHFSRRAFGWLEIYEEKDEDFEDSDEEDEDDDEEDEDEMDEDPIIPVEDEMDIMEIYIK